MEEIFKIDYSNHTALTYLQNTTIDDYRFKNNINFKYVYKKDISGKILCTQYYCMGNSYDEQGDIEIIGDNLYSNNMEINVLNYYILKTCNFGYLFFPILFLENPFNDVDKINKDGFTNKYEGNYIFYNMNGDIFFEEDTVFLYFIYPGGDPFKLNGRYKYSLKKNRNGSANITFDNKNAFILEKEGIIYFFYGEDCFIGINDKLKNEKKIKMVIPAYKNYITASSYLTEGKIKYMPSNLSNPKLDNPWVEGVSGSGIGEYIDIKWESEISGVIFLNGFISSKKPELYYLNNRIKKMIVYPDNNDIGQEIILEDTASPQYIPFNFIAKKIRFEIAEVYKGDKYDDTCLSAILGIIRENN